MVEYNRWGFIVFSEEHRRKLSHAKQGNTNGAKPYPAFVHRDTGEVIPAGFNLSAMARSRGLSRASMQAVKEGRSKQHQGWVLADSRRA